MVAETRSNWTILSANLARIWINRLGPLLGLLLVIAVFAILIGDPERYISLKNLRTVLAQTVIVAVGAIGPGGRAGTPWRRRAGGDAGNVLPARRPVERESAAHTPAPRAG